MSADDALRSLRDGNARFSEGTGNRFAAEEAAKRGQLVGGQRPATVVLACSDSRVTPAIVFDQGLGDLFVVRVAGNVVTPEVAGSVEYAAQTLGASLVVVMGHTGCGAVAATLDEVARPAQDPSPNIASIVDRIRPAVEAVLGSALDSSSDALDSGGGAAGRRETILRDAVEENVRASVRALAAESDRLRGLAAEGRIRIVGAVYALETGLVDFLDAVTRR